MEATKEKSVKNQKISLGPVTTLENYVKPDWWNRIFNSMYLKTDGDVVEDDQITKLEVDSFTKYLSIDPEDLILDLCCGQGRHSLEWGKRGFNVTGMDRSRYLIQKARNRTKKEGLSISFKEGDVRKLPFGPDKFDYICILGNSFGYFESQEEDLIVLREAFNALKPTGNILLDVSDGDFLRKNFEPRSWEWINKQMFVCRERALSRDGQKLISREVITDIRKGVVADQFYAERLYNTKELASLLALAGFSEFEFMKPIVLDPSKHSDLGMMGKRHIVIATANKSWTQVKKKNINKISKISVLLGDPRKLDIIKPGSVFDDDDLMTLNRLKTALNSLKGYSFDYIDDHEQLINKLTSLKGKRDLILNFCDEGFNNDARSELHVPALLEVLGIPYSGAGPQSLAFCYDKSLVRGTARELGIPVPQAFLVQPEDNAIELPISFPVIIKPNMGDSSFGINMGSVVFNMEDLMEGIGRVRGQQGFDRPFLIEEFLPGKDISFGLIGNPDSELIMLPLIEEDYSSLPNGYPQICGYEAKWQPDSPYGKIDSIPVFLDPHAEKVITDASITLFKRLECRDYCRFDWRLDSQGNPKLLEVNPNPGWCWDGHLAKMAKIGGKSYGDMLDSIIKTALTRANPS
ncbi:MAG: methyltransferase domain-containing protein [SAR324 cluster bacterium]|nr:methyltransferase domain-containing protein [SAR324 cluster bacterium]